jgi:hypothetical protein
MIAMVTVLIRLSTGTVFSKLPSQKTLFIFAGIVVGSLLVIASILWGLSGMHGTFSEFPRSPSLKTVWAVTKEYWLWIVIPFFLVYFVVPFFIPKEKAALAENMKKGIMVILASLFCIFPLLGWINSLEEQQTENVLHRQSTGSLSSVDCTSHSLCHLSVQANESTNQVTIPAGKQVCFESSSWDHRSELGYWTSYQGGSREEHTCTKDGVIAGTCHEPISDTFWFTPKTKIEIPGYWFVPLSASQC